MEKNVIINGGVVSLVNVKFPFL